MYFTDPVKTRMITGSDKNEVFAKRLVYEFQSGRNFGYFTSNVQEKSYQDWLKTLNAENVCYHDDGMLYRKTLKFDTYDTLFLQVNSFESSFQGCSGTLTFDHEELQSVYEGWLQKRNERLATMSRAWRESKSKHE